MKTLRIIQKIVHNKIINRTRPEIKKSINNNQLIRNNTIKNNTIKNNMENNMENNTKKSDYSYEYPYVILIDALIVK